MQRNSEVALFEEFFLHKFIFCGNASNKCLKCFIKKSGGETPVILEFGGM